MKDRTLAYFSFTLRKHSQPTLNPFIDERKDVVLVEKISRWRYSFKPGDVVVLKYVL